MPKPQPVDSFFLSTLVAKEQGFLKPLFSNARKNGYKKFVEPCAGAFAMSHLAQQAGWLPTEIESSDVALFTSVMGYAIMGKDLSGLRIEADGFAQEDLTDPATVLWIQLVLRTATKSAKEYFKELLVDLYRRKPDHIEKIRSQLDHAKSLLNGMDYRPLCMWKHLEECLDDPTVLVCINPPTYAAGFEKWYNTNGKLRWQEPEYGMFDPATGMVELMQEKAKDAKALVLCYEETEPGKCVGEPVFSRFGVRTGINVYLTCNRPDEAAKLAEGKKIYRQASSGMEPLDSPIMPDDYEIKPNSVIVVRKIEAGNSKYYRWLWTHNFTGAQAQYDAGVFIDGYIAGVFGYDKSALGIGAFGAVVNNDIFLMYGMTIKHRTYRMGRLVTLLASCRKMVKNCLTDFEYEKLRGMQTVMQTKYPESKEERGLMKLTKKTKDPKHGYKLVYRCELRDINEQEALVLWLRKETEWRKARKKSTSDTD